MAMSFPFVLGIPAQSSDAVVSNLCSSLAVGYYASLRYSYFLGLTALRQLFHINLKSLGRSLPRDSSKASLARAPRNRLGGIFKLFRAATVFGELG